MDQLDIEIASARDRVAELHERLRIEQAKLEALEHAARLRPASQEGNTIPRGSESIATRISKGRQPGAISHQWRKMLRLILDEHHGVATATQIAALGQRAGVANLTPIAVRQRLKTFFQPGYVSLDADDVYRVTELAIKRFDLRATDSQLALAPVASTDEQG